jgi:hypothetical protein
MCAYFNLPPFSLAAKFKSMECMQHLLNLREDLVLDQINDQGESAIYHVVKSANPKMLRQLVAAGLHCDHLVRTDPSVFDQSKFLWPITAVEWAFNMTATAGVHPDDEHFEDYLLHCRQDFENPEWFIPDYKTARQYHTYMQKLKKKNVEIVKILVAAGCKLNPSRLTDGPDEVSHLAKTPQPLMQGRNQTKI